ncbi:MAG: LPP20 family lipoprotein [Pseudomonadales bacterium]|nr:LPP20 family lipoprotein [Pseudomonadales bacterium]
MTKKHLLAVSLLVSLLAACGSNETQPATTQSLGIYDLEACKWKDGKDNAPAWSCNQLPADDKFVAFAKGEARTSKYDATLSENTAQAAALAGLKQQIEASVEKGLRQASVQSGAAGTADETLDTANKQVLNLIVEGSVKNSRLLKTITGPDGYTYVLMGIAREGYDELVEASVKSSMGNAKAQYQILLAGKIQEEFDKEFSKQVN